MELFKNLLKVVGLPGISVDNRCNSFAVKPEKIVNVRAIPRKYKGYVVKSVRTRKRGWDYGESS